MKKLLSTTALLLALTFSGAASAATAPTAEPKSYFDHALGVLTKHDASAFRDTMSEAHEENRDLYEQIHQVHEDLHSILTADSFDRVAFEEKSMELRKLHNQIGKNIDQSFAAAIESLSTKERLRFADALEASHEEHRAHKAKESE